MSRITRLVKILRTVGRYRLDELLDADKLPATLRFSLRISPWRLNPVPDLSRGARLRKAPHCTANETLPSLHLDLWFGAILT